jgi:hypothetical protein
MAGFFSKSYLRILFTVNCQIYDDLLAATLFFLFYYEKTYGLFVLFMNT